MSQKKCQEVSFSSIWLFAVLLGIRRKTLKQRNDLHEIYKVCAYLDDEVHNQTFEAFRSAYYRARRQYGRAQITFDTM